MCLCKSEARKFSLILFFEAGFPKIPSHENGSEGLNGEEMEGREKEHTKLTEKVKLYKHQQFIIDEGHTSGYRALV